MATIRRRFGIVHGEAGIKRVNGDCRRCRKYLATAGKEMLAPPVAVSTQQVWLPLQFAEVGYFVPLLVNPDRKTKKRYECLFTCLQMHAVHLEVSHPLSTASFIVAPLRFMIKRRTSSEFFNDNGKYFIGGQCELESLVENWSRGRIFDVLMQKGVQRNFNPLTSVTEEEYGRSWFVW